MYVQHVAMCLVIVALAFDICNVVPPPPASPLWFVYFPSEIATVNGSSPVNCGTTFDSDMDTLLCDHPNTSVLFDGNVPTLTGLD